MTSLPLANPAPGIGPDAAGARPQAAEPHSYPAILKSSMLIGGSSMLVICIGIVRTKAMAVLLGPAGYAVMGAYILIADLARSIAQMGLNGSGVRQIAEAAASGDARRAALTVTVLRRVAMVCGLLGAALLLALSEPISMLTFGTAAHARPVAWLSLAVFFGVVAGGQGALLQGLRRIADLARIGVLGALFGTAVSIPLVYLLGHDGLVPALVAVAALSAVTSWWYSRRVDVAPVALGAAQFAQATSSLLRLGLAFLASGLLMMGAAYVVRIIVLRQVGLEAAGLYQAAWTLGGLYVGYILQALGADFYPRLVGAAADDAESNRLVNEQAQVSLLLATPGVLATLTLAPLAMTIFYSANFADAVPILRWICLGMALRVMTWPIGYIVVARNRQLLFFGMELSWALVNVGLTWLCVRAAGVDGAGIAFLGSYVFHALVTYPVARLLTGFTWSAANRRTLAWSTALIAAVFVALQNLPAPWSAAFGLSVTLLSACVSVRTLRQLVRPDRLASPLRRLLHFRRQDR